MKHNAFNDFQSYPAQGNASFDMKPYLNQPNSAVKVYLTRKTYQSGIKTDTLIYNNGGISTKSVIKNSPSSLQ